MGFWRILFHSPTLKRFFIFHFILPFLLLGFAILHLFYLHFLSSNNPLRNSTNNKIPFFPFILQKDFVGLILVLCLYFLQTHFGVSSLSHPDNALEACALLTPLHIVPEWYFLCQYAMLKAVPKKNAGFIILLTSILTLFFFGEIRNLTTFTRLIDCNNGFFFFFFFFFFPFFSLDRCSIPSREVSILCSYLDIILLFSSYVYLIFSYFSFITFMFLVFLLFVFFFHHSVSYQLL